MPALSSVGSPGQLVLVFSLQLQLLANMDCSWLLLVATLLALFAVKQYGTVKLDAVTIKLSAEGMSYLLVLSL